jgi:hypothetical protein
MRQAWTEWWAVARDVMEARIQAAARIRSFFASHVKGRSGQGVDKFSLSNSCRVLVKFSLSVLAVKFSLSSSHCQVLTVKFSLSSSRQIYAVESLSSLHQFLSVLVISCIFISSQVDIVNEPACSLYVVLSILQNIDSIVSLDGHAVKIADKTLYSKRSLVEGLLQYIRLT